MDFKNSPFAYSLAPSITHRFLCRVVKISLTSFAKRLVNGSIPFGGASPYSSAGRAVNSTYRLFPLLKKCKVVQSNLTSLMKLTDYSTIPLINQRRNDGRSKYKAKT